MCQNNELSVSCWIPSEKPNTPNATVKIVAIRGSRTRRASRVIYDYRDPLIFENAGYRTMTKTPGKMQQINGNSILTGAF